MKVKPDVRSARVMLMVSVALFGVGWPFTKFVLRDIAPLPFLALEMMAAACCAVVIAVVARSRWPDRGGVLAYAGLGVVSPGINYALAIGGLSLTSASAAALVSATEPLAIIVLAVVFLRERLDASRLWPIALGVAGVLLVEDPFGGVAHASIAGTAIVAVGVGFGAVFVVLQRRAPDVDLLAGVAVQQCTGALTLALAAFAVHGTQVFTQIAALPRALVGATLSAGLMLDYLPFLLLVLTARRLTGAASGMAFTLMPVWGVGISVLALGERPALVQVAGGAAIVAALVAFERGAATAASTPA